MGGSGGKVRVFVVSVRIISAGELPAGVTRVPQPTTLVDSETIIVTPAGKPGTNWVSYVDAHVDPNVNGTTASIRTGRKRTSTLGPLKPRNPACVALRVWNV